MSTDGPATTPRTRPLGRVLSFCWRLGDRGGPVPVLALAAAAMFVVQLGRPIHDVDIFWQLKLGDLTLAGGLPPREPFVAGKQDERLAVVAWLSQVVYAAARQLGGWTLLWLLDAAVWFGGFVAVALAWSHGRRNLWPVTAGLWLGWLAALPTASLRPQSFSALAFGLLLVLMRANLSVTRTAVLGAVLFVAWQNLHPSVVVGAGVLGVAAFAEAVQFWRKRRPGPPTRLFLLLALSVASAVATPAGIDLFRIAAVNADVSRYLGVSEWQPLTWQPLEFGRPFAWAVLAVTVVGVGLAGRRLHAATFAIVLALTAATVLSHRFVLFWGIAVVAVWGELLASGLEDSTRPIRSRVRHTVAVIAVALSVLGPALFNPAPFGGHYPFAAVDALRAADMRGTVYCSYYWGGVVIDGGYPAWRVSHDGRYYLFSRAEWDVYFAVAGGEVAVADVVAKHRPVAFFLRPGGEDGLIARLRGHPAWRLLYADDNAVVFVPRNTVAGPAGGR